MALSHAVQAHYEGTFTLDPVPATLRPTISPRTAWESLGPQNLGGTTRFFLAYLSSSIPASLEPDGTLRPTYQHVLAWVDYGEGLPFDTAFMSGPRQSGDETPPKPTCRFVGQSVKAWDATTGQQIIDAGFVPSNGKTLHLALTPWTPVHSGSTGKA
jgi:hypothetical protein